MTGMFTFSNVQGVAMVVVGLWIVRAVVLDMRRRSRWRQRRQEAQGVVVGSVGRGAIALNRRSDIGRSAHAGGRAAVIRFATSDGRTVDVVSDFSSSPGPKVGKQVAVVYDPDDPEGTADRHSVWKFKRIVSPILLAVGIGVIAGGVFFVAT